MQRIVHTSKSPFEMFLLVALILTGAAGLLDPGRSSNAIAHILPAWGQLVWYSGLLLGGLLAMTGVVTNRLWSLFIERGGLLMTGWLCVTYTGAVIALAGPLATFAGVLTLGFAVSCFVRAYQISRDIKHIFEDPQL